MKQTLPSGPSSLCFNKEDFMKGAFHVEQFVVECRRRVPLDNLRDDLSVYLKILQSAMIELINKDYADFVNLSTNLVGMDKAINNLMSPLNQLKHEVVSVRNAMDEATSAIEQKMSQKSEIREKKACLQRLIKIIQCVEKMENLLGIGSMISGDSSTTSTPEHHQPEEVTGQLIERVATEFNKLQFFVNKSRGFPLVEEIRPRVMNITTTLQYSLEGSFKEGLETDNAEILRQCLRTYATIDKMRDAENLFRQHIVEGHFEDIISEHTLKTNPQGLKGMYAEVLDFIPRHCKILKDVTTGSGADRDEIVRGYDFLVNSVWPEVVTGIENRTPAIFAPGNPEIFHEKYLTSMEFLDKFERQCGSQASVRRLRSHPRYSTFMSKWSLPVYFQIRFQEIAGALESALISPLNPAADRTLFHLHATYTLWQSLGECWQQQVYLQPLCHRFWKLNLQLLSRYASWVEEVDHVLIRSASQNSSDTPLKLTSSASDSNIVLAEARARSNENVVQHAPPVTTSVISMGQVVSIIADIQMLSVMLNDYFHENVKPRMQELGMKDMRLLVESLQDSQHVLSRHLPDFGQYIIREITAQCSVNLKTVNDIPRLYRRTNREVPKKPSTYVHGLMKPIQSFLSDHESMIGEENRTEWMESVLQSISDSYLTITTDVLTAVKKMEESLKRLKKAKGASSSTSQGLSDDDKIRLQLYLDVKELGDQIDILEIDKSRIEAFGKLFSLVEAAKNS